MEHQSVFEKVRMTISASDILIFCFLLIPAFYFNQRTVHYIQSIISNPTKTKNIIILLTITTAISFIFYIAYIRVILSKVIQITQ
jgi:hypothetical protein